LTVIAALDDNAHLDIVAYVQLLRLEQEGEHSPAALLPAQDGEHLPAALLLERASGWS
jgi:hypothetical protein